MAAFLLWSSLVNSRMKVDSEMASALIRGQAIGWWRAHRCCGGGLSGSNLGCGCGQVAYNGDNYCGDTAGQTKDCGQVVRQQVLWFLCWAVSVSPLRFIPFSLL